MIVLTALALTALALFVACSGSTPAHVADSKTHHYSITSADIRAQLQADGSLHIVDRRSFSVEDSFGATSIGVGDHPYYSGASVESVRMAHVGDPEPQDFQALPATDYKDGWWRDLSKDYASAGAGWSAQLGAPDYDCYAFSEEDRSLLLFSDAGEGELVAEVEYTLFDYAQRFNDCGALEWEFFMSNESCAATTCTLALPAPEGDAGQAGEDVVAWLKSPGGAVDVRGDGSIVADVPQIDPSKVTNDNYCLNAVFPPEWIAGASKALPVDYRDKIIAQTDEDSANAARSNGERPTIISSDVSVDVLSDGSLHVVEETLFDRGDSLQVVSYLPKGGGAPADTLSGNVKLVSFHVAEAARGDGASYEDAPEAFLRSEWVAGGGPGISSYCKHYDVLCAFFDEAQDEQRIRVEYVVPEAVSLDDDWMVLDWPAVIWYWPVVAREDVVVQDVSCTVNLPVPQGWQFSEEDVQCEAHGLGVGTSNVEEPSEATLGRFKASFEDLDAGSAASARLSVSFPPGWCADAL